MSWLQIPKKVQKLHNDSLLGITIDYEKYMCADASAVLHMIRQMGFCGELDTDNSNQETCHDQSMTLVHSKNKYGWTYSVHANLPGFASYEMFQFCQYSESQSTIFRSEGGIDFRGAFFKFKEIMAEQSPEIVHFYDRVRRMSEFK